MLGNCHSSGSAAFSAKGGDLVDAYCRNTMHGVGTEEAKGRENFV